MRSKPHSCSARDSARRGARVLAVGALLLGVACGHVEIGSYDDVSPIPGQVDSGGSAGTGGAAGSSSSAGGNGAAGSNMGKAGGASGGQAGTTEGTSSGDAGASGAGGSGGGKSHCGNAVVEMGEECDDGMETAECNKICTFARCGDGHTNHTAGEDCDWNGEETIYCHANCIGPRC